MLRTSLLLLFLTTSILANSQIEKMNYKTALKIYNLTRFENENVYSDTTGGSVAFTTATFKVFHPAFAVQWKGKKNNFHELELTDFSLNKVKNETKVIDLNGNVISHTGGGHNMTTNIALRYEYQVNFSRSKDKRLIPGIGISLSPYFKQSNNLPLLSNEFPTYKQKIGVAAFVIPRLYYQLSSKLFLDFNVPFYIADAGVSTIRVENPIVPVSQRKISFMEAQSLPKYFSFRFGLGIKI